ncbi:MAG: ABC transporter ATP-binding protein, partial [Verrucomicrobiota bacterium]
MPEPIITVRDVSKVYRIWGNPAARLASPVWRSASRLLPGAWGAPLQKKAESSYRDFYALQNVSFEIGRGERWGIIGRNGCGKSTLLQIIAGTLQPTSGDVRIQGKVAALLELGSGFNPEFTGRENVYLNGAVHGFSRVEMDAKYPEIEAFADIGSFIDQPTKTYSSGMTVRLAFAVAINTAPDILIVDEALSVGDVFFQQKCFEQIRKTLAAGTTLLFVSHDLAAVQNLCQKAVLLESGRMIHLGLPEECASRYYARHTPGQPPVSPARAAHGRLGDRSAAELIMRDNLV